jgi:hypothetical protein
VKYFLLASIQQALQNKEIQIEENQFLPLPLVDEDDGLGEEEEAARERQVQRVLAGAAGQSEEQLASSWAEAGARPPFISCSTVRSKVVFFDVTTNLCPGVTQSFPITFTPRYPAQLCLLDLPLAEEEPQLTVLNGATLPSLTLACFDTFNNRTDPPEVCDLCMCGDDLLD